VALGKVEAEELARVGAGENSVTALIQRMDLDVKGAKIFNDAL
jgi:hypothetical protein